jgi:hypothetical protein
MRAHVIIASLLPLLLAAGCAQEKTVSFQNDVNPILQKNCLECHSGNGEGYKKSGLSMESYEALMKGTKFGPVLVPGQSISSTLVRLLQGKADPSINMPHQRDALPEDKAKIIVQWIDQGAKNN